MGTVQPVLAWIKMDVKPLMMMMMMTLQRAEIRCMIEGRQVFFIQKL
mgnify:CR=1 FL=1